MKSIFFFFSLIALFALSACDNSNERGDKQDEFAPDSIINTEGMSEAEIAELECLSHADYICESGLFFVRLGDFVADVQPEELEDAEVQDSVVSENGYDWLVRTLNLKEGRIIVEGEFIDQRQSNDSLLSITQVNRLRVETPLFQTNSNMRVGDEVKKLKETFASETFQIVSIPAYQAIDIQVDNQKFHYLIEDVGNKIAESIGPEITFENLPKDAKIYSIVVM